MAPDCYASNWNSCYLDGIRNGISPAQNRSCCMPLTGSWNAATSCGASENECKLPPINPGGFSGNYHSSDPCSDRFSCPCPPPCSNGYCVEKVYPIKPSTEEYQPPCVPFDGCSQYRCNYRGQYGPPARSLRRDDWFTPSSGRMSCCTHYREMYTCKPLAVERAHRNDEMYVPPSEPFSGCSLYRTDFVPKCYVKTMSAKPSDYPSFADAAFSGCTTYKNDYLPFYFKKCCPCPRVSCRPNCC